MNNFELLIPPLPERPANVHPHTSLWIHPEQPILAATFDNLDFAIELAGLSLGIDGDNCTEMYANSKGNADRPEVNIARYDGPNNLRMLAVGFKNSDGESVAVTARNDAPPDSGFAAMLVARNKDGHMTANIKSLPEETFARITRIVTERGVERSYVKADFSRGEFV